MGRGLSAALPACQEVQLEGDGEDVARPYKLAHQEQYRQYLSTFPYNQRFYFPEIVQIRKLFPHGYHKYTRNVLSP